MTLRARLLPAVLLPALLLTGCSSSDEPDSPAAPVADPPATAGEAPTAGSGTGAQVQPGATLLAVVGEPESPDAFTIGLTDQSGVPVTELPAGTYTIEVQDLSSIHNFRLSGPGVDEATSVEEVGSQTFEVTLEAGEYTYVCDPHPSMVGDVTVV